MDEYIYVRITLTRHYDDNSRPPLIIQQMYIKFKKVNRAEFKEHCRNCFKKLERGTDNKFVDEMLKNKYYAYDHVRVTADVYNTVINTAVVIKSEYCPKPTKALLEPTVINC